MKKFINIVFLFVWISFVFVGDYSIGDFYILPFLSLMVVLMRFVFWPVKRVDVLLFFLSVFLFLPLSVKFPFFEVPSYYLFLPAVFASIFSFGIVDRIFSEEVLGRYLVFFLLIVLFVYTILFKMDDIRLDVIWGSNILYRVILFFVVVLCLYGLAGGPSLYFAVLVSLIGFFLIFKTGSRGGLLAAVMIFILAIIHTRSYKFLVFLSVSLIFSAYFIFSSVSLDDVLSVARFLRFDGESSEVRVGKFGGISALLNSEDFLWGFFSPSKITGVYPHNVLVEAIVYHGVVFGVIFSVLYFTFPFFIMSRADIRKLSFPYVPIWVGALFSGSFLDNYVSLGLVLYVLVVAIFSAPAEG